MNAISLRQNEPPFAVPTEANMSASDGSPRGRCHADVSGIATEATFRPPSGRKSGVWASIRAECPNFPLLATNLQLHLLKPKVPIRNRVGLGARTSNMAAKETKESVMSAPEAVSLPPTFNRLAWSNLAAQSAEQIALAAAPIVAVLLLGVGEGETGLLQTALTLPFILFAIPAGLLADRISRRRLMAGAEALRAVALLAILLLIGLHQLTMPLLALAGFVAVCGTVVYSVTAPALVPSLVSSQQLPAANARIELARTVAFASGPALGGVLVGWLGAAPAFAVAAALSVVAVVLLSDLYEPQRAAVTRRHPLHEIKEGAALDRK